GGRGPGVVMAAAVRWSCRFRLSLADVSDLLAERGIDVSPRTILTWVHTFGPLLAAAVRRAARPVGRRWYCDETYVRVAGAWAYVYRAVDDYGQVVDVLLRARRDLASARAFFAPAPRRRRRPPGPRATRPPPTPHPPRPPGGPPPHRPPARPRGDHQADRAVPCPRGGPVAADAWAPIDRLRTAAPPRHRGRPGDPPG